MTSCATNATVRAVGGNLRRSSARMSRAYNTIVNNVGRSSTQEQDANSTNPWSKKVRIDQGQCHSDGKDRRHLKERKCPRGLEVFNLIEENKPR